MIERLECQLRIVSQLKMPQGKLTTSNEPSLFNTLAYSVTQGETLTVVLPQGITATGVVSNEMSFSKYQTIGSGGNIEDSSHV